MINLVQLLLKHGANPNRPLFVGDFSPLMHAMCSKERPVDLVNLLLESGADPNATSGLPVDPRRPYHASLHLPAGPQPPLKWAVLLLPVSQGWETRIQIVEALLARGGTRNDHLWRSDIIHDVIEGTASDGHSAAVPFAVARHLCELLLKSGANPNCLRGGDAPLQKVASAAGLDEGDRMRLAGLLAAAGAWE